ncbi:hypothetical protein Bca101_048780 [Brassica carinata]
MDRVSKWCQSIDSGCVLCKNATESRNHLFFECTYSLQLWEDLVSGILGHAYTKDWSSIVLIISDSTMERKKLFCVRYAFQAAIYAIWRERNRIRHGEKALPIDVLKKLTDKGIRNKLSLIRVMRRKRMEEVLQFWFQTRI